jgi:hypothetical protein
MEVTLHRPRDDGVVIHGKGRPRLGRKLHGKSRRELRDLGLLVEEAAVSGQQNG